MTIFPQADADASPNTSRIARICGVAGVVGALLVGASGLPACGDDVPATMAPGGRLVLKAAGPELFLIPGAAGPVFFLLTTPAGDPVVSERLDFSAIDDPATPVSDLAGATLSAASGVTDKDGMSVVVVTGGLPTKFALAAKHPRANGVQVLITVNPAQSGTIDVVPTLAVGSRATSVVTTVDVLVFDGASCRDLSAIDPPAPVRPMRTVAIGGAAEFAIAGSMMSAVIGEGRDNGGVLRAAGCINVPGSTVVAGTTVRTYLPLLDLDPIARGTFLLSSRFSLAKHELTARMADPWHDLGDCPLDPGQLWLDCAIDALGSPAGDALDCVPSANEGELATAIMARRASTTAGAPCRAAALPGGAQSVDAKVAALFPSPAQSPASEIDALGPAVGALLDDFALGSTLALEASAVAGTFQATHTLRSATFRVGTQVATVDIVAQGIPNAQVRFIPVTTVGDLLSVGTHGLGLRLGTLAHAAFAQVALVGRGLPASTSAYLGVLYGLATYGVASARQVGCAALDGLVCGEVGRAAGCLLAACVAGQAALAARLDAAFSLADGERADLQLSGSAVMTDDTLDGIADRLGAAAGGSAGLWAAQIRASAGVETISGGWGGTRTVP